MKVSIVVGGVEIQVEGLSWSQRQVKDLLGEVAGIAVALEDAGYVEPQPEPVEPVRQRFGYTLDAQTEIAEVIEPDLSEYFEEEEEDHKPPM